MTGKYTEVEQFVEMLVKRQDDLDEDILKEEWTVFKEKYQKDNKNNKGPKLKLKFLQRSISKQSSLVKTPQILCIHLNRVTFSQMGTEILNDTPVLFPNVLDLASCIESISPGSQRYRLASLVEHHGFTPHSGHYVAYKKLISDFPNDLKPNVYSQQCSPKWIRANDEQITILNQEDVLNRTQGAYLLFYEKIPSNEQ